MMNQMAIPNERMNPTSTGDTPTAAALDAPGDAASWLEPDVTDEATRTMEEVSTADLVGRARDGDREAYAMLFSRFHDEIYRFASRRIGDPVAGQDIAADTFVDAFGSIARFKWRGVPFEAWLYTIARRRIADLMRARARADRLTPPLEPSVASDHSGAVLDALHVRDLISRLSESERDVIELRFMEDLDVQQTALRLEKSAGAIRVTQHRALQRLRAMAAEGAA